MSKIAKGINKLLMGGTSVEQQRYDAAKASPPAPTTPPPSAVPPPVPKPTTKASTILTGPQGLQDDDLHLAKRYLSPL